NTSFRCTVVSQTYPTSKSPHGRGTDEPAPVMSAHPRKDSPEAIVSSIQMHAEHPIPLCLGEFGKWHLFGNTGVAEENIDTTEFTLSSRNRGLDRLQTCHINLKRERSASQSRDFLHCGFSAGKIHVAECH